MASGPPTNGRAGGDSRGGEVQPHQDAIVRQWLDVSSLRLTDVDRDRKEWELVHALVRQLLREAGNPRDRRRVEKSDNYQRLLKTVAARRRTSIDEVKRDLTTQAKQILRAGANRSHS